MRKIRCCGGWWTIRRIHYFFICIKIDVDVLMIEKRQEIGTPVQCAEGVTYGTFETLEMNPQKNIYDQELKVHIYMHQMAEESLMKVVLQKELL